jgi:hypothetical protein
MKDLHEYAHRVVSNLESLDESRLKWMWDTGKDAAKLVWDTVTGGAKKIKKTDDPKLLTHQPSNNLPQTVPNNLPQSVPNKIVGLSGKGKATAGAVLAGAATLAALSDDDKDRLGTEKEPGQRKEDEMRKALKQQAATALNKKPGEQHPGVGDRPKAESKPEKKPSAQQAPKSEDTPSDLTWSAYSAKKVKTTPSKRADLARETASKAWDAAANKNLSKEARTKAAFLAKKLQDRDMRGGR